MEKLGSYLLTGHLTSQNSGYSVWGFGKKNGRDFFIKQFLSPKYPDNDTVSSAASIEKRKKKCEKFQQKKAAMYKMINDNSDGNAVRIEEFFRVESKYYISMRKIEALEWSVETIAALPEKDKRFLCSVIAHGIAGLHKGRVVHADLKHDNILLMKTASGNVTAKIIDFDSGFLETDPPTDGEEIVGDQVYFSPEACKTFMGESPELTCKMDVFALGVLFHQYFTGVLPGYDVTLGNYAGEAVARGGVATVSEELPQDVRDLLVRMLDGDPAKRPTAAEVYAVLAAKPHEELPTTAVEEKAGPAAAKAASVPEKPEEPEVAAEAPQANMFFVPGDL